MLTFAKLLVTIALVALAATPVAACVNDSDTEASEKKFNVVYVDPSGFGPAPTAMNELDQLLREHGLRVVGVGLLIAAGFVGFSRRSFSRRSNQV